MMGTYPTCYKASYRSAGVKSVSGPVKKYAYYEGRVFQKYRVGIMLPAKLGMSMIMPA
jgi:hypothetical protein